MPPLIQFYSDSVRYSPRGTDDFVLRRIILRLKLSNLAFLIDMWNECATSVFVVLRRE